MKLDVRKCLDIVCEIQRAIFVRQLGRLAMFLNGDKMMRLFKLRLHLLKKEIKMVQKERRKSGGSYLYTSALKFPCDSYAAISVCKPRKLT